MEKKYEVGYCQILVNDFSFLLYEELKKYSEICDKIVIGIPGEEITARVFGDQVAHSCEQIKNIFMDFCWIEDVLILDKAHLDYTKVYEEIHFNVCFYGSEYGHKFEKDKVFFEENQVDFLSRIPETMRAYEKYDALTIALNNIPKEHKIVLFGSGAYFDNYMKQYGGKYLPAYAIDNQKEKWGTKKQGILINSPEALAKEKSEEVFVVICSKNYSGMVTQLKEMGDYNYRTLLYDNQFAILEELSVLFQDEKEYMVKSHTILYRLMKEFDRVCKKHNLHYYVICGSLIGVVRHQGMIPWDDDMDVAMTREDYEKLQKIAPLEWNQNQYIIQDYREYGNGAFLDIMCRFVDMQEKLPNKIFDKVSLLTNGRLDDRNVIDIYVLDNASNNEKRHMHTMYRMKCLYGLLMGHRGKIDYTEYDRLPNLMRSILRISNWVGRCIPLKWLFAMYEHLRKYAKQEQSDSYYIASCSVMCFERKFKKEFFQEGQQLPMGDMMVTVPKDYDGLLNAMGYHNYMQFPPMSLRKPSHYINSDISIW